MKYLDSAFAMALKIERESYYLDNLYCQDRNINILNRVCRELTRLSRSKHTLVNILTIGEIEHP